MIAVVDSLINRTVGKMKPGMFRLILALLVVLHHGLRIFPVGAFAVYTFFMLSGYWVGKMYEEFYSKQRSPYWLFLSSRVWRLYPLYWLCTIAMVLLAKFYIVERFPVLGVKECSFMTLLVPLNLLDFKLLNPAWSLAVEMQFYILVPMFIWLIKRCNHYFLVIVALTLTLFFTFYFERDYKFNETVLGYLIYFLIGMLIYFRRAVVSQKLLSASVLTILAILFFSCAIPSLRHALLYEREGDVYGYYHFFNHVLPFFFIPFIVHNVVQKSDVMDRHLGDLSYTVYLVHWIPLSIYVRQFPYGGITVEKMVGFGIALGATFVLSMIIYYFFERLVASSRKRFIAKSTVGNP